MKTGLLLAGLRINFNQRAPLEGFITPCIAVWDRSGLIEENKSNYAFPCSPLQLELLFGKKLLGSSIGRGLGALKGLIWALNRAIFPNDHSVHMIKYKTRFD